MTGLEFSRVLDDRYELIELVGSGGMADVWRARDRRLDRDVAVKILSGAAVGDASRRKKIEREARALAAASHPNIVAVFDYGEADENGNGVHPFLVMELVDGPDLHQYLTDRGRPLEIDESQDLMVGILSAVERAHSAGVVHGDLKPANVFISPHGPKVGDFGVARLLDEETGTTTIAATPTFAAPEVLKGERSTPASDVYSAGCIAFQLLAGRPPFEGSNAWEVAAKHIDSPVPRVRKIRSDVPARLDAVIQKAMEKDPRRRFADAASFASAIAQIPSEGNAAAVVPPTATVPVSPPAQSAVDATQALTRPRPDAARIALLGPLAAGIDRLKRVRAPNAKVLLIALVALLLAVGFLTMRDTSGDPVLVPDVRGDSVEDAAAELRLKGFKVNDVSYRPVVNAKSNQVLDTIPKPKDEVAPGSEVHLIASAIARTPAPVVQPNAGGDDGDGESAADRRRERRKGKREKDD